IVVATHEAIAALGYTPSHNASSTDANLPMSLGIPAVTIGSGGAGGRAHALDEWIDVEKGPSVKGMSVGLAALLTVAGVE
ncbi:MAG TPA: peptidase M20, partial [Phenylobacterium sp.]|nr:peptidase M20 [Phenylobacterium sp.]